ncbi:MAG: hypothetical protein QFX35_04220 [Candidatus Verstraetearchaeota archaeon]|nr:hypothetical protein [Candidatus Verstraetearchaeota archaeon]
MRQVSQPLRAMFLVLTLSTVGVTALLAAFLSAHPYFSPFQPFQLPRGWVDQNTYVSENFTIARGGMVKDIFGYAGAGGQSIMILGVQPLAIGAPGSIFVKFNGIPLGETYINQTLVVNTSIASCCFVTLIQTGVDNVVEITSKDFVGEFRYLIIIPTGGR